MSKVQSMDGTTIGFDVRGSGPPLVIVHGATAYRAIAETDGLADALADSFRVYSYDRRGRGESGDTKPYAVEREIEDIAALIAHAGEPAVVFGASSGAVLSLDAAAAGLPITHVVAFEPPFVVDDQRPPLPADYVERLEAACAAGRPGDAVELFMTAAAGVPAEFVAGMRGEPFWGALESVAPTIAYDGRIMGDTMSGNPLPADRWEAVKVPVLFMHGDKTWPFLRSGPAAAAELLPTATLRAVPGENHSAGPDVLAPAIREFVTEKAA